jgi:hypothetical protein
MSKQVRFLVVRDDLMQFLAFAEEQGFRALPVVIESDTIPDERRPTNAAFEHNYDFFYLLPSDFAVVEAFYDELPNYPGLSRLLDETSPVIEVSPAIAPRDLPAEGRIYIDPDSQDPRGPAAMRSFDVLARFLKKWPKSSDGRFHVGPHAAIIIRTQQTNL